MGNERDFPKWDQGKSEESVKATYEWAVSRAMERIAWYEKNRMRKKTWALAMRAAAIGLGSAGVLFPLLDTTRIFDQYTLLGMNVLPGQWGYIAIAFAASIVGFDKFFGLSSGWIRYITTQFALEKALQDFQYDWAIMNAQPQPAPNPQGSEITRLQKIKDFSSQVEALVKQETDAWVAEFQSNMAELEKTLKSEMATRKPGSIKVTVANAGKFDKVLISLDGAQKKELEGVTEGVINMVPPGRYEIIAKGLKAGKETRASRVVEVQADTMSAAEITVPEA